MELGQIVLSKCGRDKERYYFIVEIDTTEEYVFIADGDLRRVEKPKRKKCKHLVAVGTNETVKYKIENNIKITNAELRKLIKSHNEASEN